MSGTPDYADEPDWVRPAEILFRDRGSVGGKISIKKAGKEVVKRSLATKVENDYLRARVSAMVETRQR